MSLFESASLVVTPNGAKASKLYAIKPTSGAGDLSVTRATTATRVNSAGLIESVASNVPRLDYTNGSCPSILVEPQRTNLLRYSQDLTQWDIFAASGAITRTANYAISPDGTSNATRIQNSGGTTVQWTYQNILHSTNVFTLWYKRTGSVNQTFRIFSNNGTNHSPNITATDTWQKYTYSFSGLLTIPVGITTDSSGNASDILIYGGQIEAGSYATSYIPTTSASVTRNADVISKTGISSLIGQTEGTLFCDVLISSIEPSIFHTFISIYGNLNNRVVIGKSPDTSNIFFYTEANGVSTYQTITKPLGRYKIALGYKNGNSCLYINGVSVFTSSNTLSFSTSLTDFYINERPTGLEIGQFNLYNSALWKTRLTNAELAELTTL
jgi:hypothetical protein